MTGHTPTANIPNHGRPEAYKANGHIAIDCGCASGGRLCAYCFETDSEFYVDKINQPLKITSKCDILVPLNIITDEDKTVCVTFAGGLLYV